MKYAKLLLLILTFSLFTVTGVQAQSQSGWWSPRTSAVDDENGDRPRVIVGERDRDARETRGRTGDARTRRGGDNQGGEARGRRGRGNRSGDARTRRGRDQRDDDVHTRRDRGDEEPRTRRGEERRDGGILGRRDGSYENDRRNRRGGNGGGPPFCRSGAGHPVFGMEWCYEKGFEGDRRYERSRRIEDIIFGEPRRTTRRGTLDNRTVGDILGDVVLGRLQQHSRSLGSRAPLEGRMVRLGGSNGRVLQLRSGSMPVAELTDRDGDRRVDIVWLNEGR